MAESNTQKTDVEALVAPQTHNRRRIVVSNVQSPGKLCCIQWHPTAATFTVDDFSYRWNSRVHRKLRYPQGPQEAHPPKWIHRIRFLGWEPHIVTWYICWVGVIANTLWVVNGLYATWPDAVSSGETAELTSFATGVVGAFLFIVTGYLGYIEAVNQTFSGIVLPKTRDTWDEATAPNTSNHKNTDTKKQLRRFLRPTTSDYGQWISSLAYPEEHLAVDRLIRKGYPVVRDDDSEKLITASLFDRFLEKHSTDASQTLKGRKVSIAIGDHVIHATIDDFDTIKGEIKGMQLADNNKGYRWWTWHPDYIHHMGIFNSLVFFVSTILFFIPACVWLPMGRHGASTASLIFWAQVMQIIPCIGFIYTGHAAMAEASGSWWKPAPKEIGWWISLFNTIGGYGFMAYAILAIPITVEPDSFADLTKWGADFGTFWGSCAFWVAGILQCIEFGSQHPIAFVTTKESFP